MKNKKSRKYIYYVAVYPDENGSYMVVFPDFPDMAADFGRTFEDCINSGTNFLKDVVSEMVDNGEQLPVPTPAQDLCSKVASRDNLLCIVPITVYPPAKTQRINITGKGDTFARIRDYAKSRHLTRSELMIKATLEYIRENQ